MFDVEIGGRKVEYDTLKFSGGEIQVRIKNTYRIPSDVSDDCQVVIDAHLTDSDKIMELVMLVDAFRQLDPSIRIKLICPYIPYARQDRVCADGEALAVKVFANIINSLNFTNVEVSDAHSDVSLAVIDRVKNFGPETYLENLLNIYSKPKADFVLVSPDAGALKKVGKVAKKFNLPTVTASKIRNPQNGEITGTQIHIPAEHYLKTFLIVDDICDGGRTFTELAKAIDFEILAFNKDQNIQPKIELYVTHGIFSKGLDVIFESGIQKIYTKHPFPNVKMTYSHVLKLWIAEKPAKVETAPTE